MKDQNSIYRQFRPGETNGGNGRQGPTRMMVCGSSMLPFFRPGDMVAVRAVSPATIRLGSVILFSAHEGAPRIMHRVVKIICEKGARRYLCQGDNRFSPDGWIDEEQVLGKIVGRFHNKDFKPVRRYHEYGGLVLTRWYRQGKSAAKKTFKQAWPVLSRWSRTITVLDQRGRRRDLVFMGRGNFPFRRALNSLATKIKARGI